MTVLGTWRWEGDELLLVPPRPCFDLVRFGVRCRRPLGHGGQCSPRPLEEDQETSPTSLEVSRAYSRRRTRTLRAAGATRLGEIPGTPAFYREKRARERAEQRARRRS